MIELANLSRSFGQVRALWNVNLLLQPGVSGLVGNNGAGKSTLLKILLGMLEPDAGTGLVLGHRLSAQHAIRGKVGYMAESATIVPALKGVEFVTLSGDLYGMPHRDAKRRAHEVLGYVGLGELRYRKLEEYSTGNLQRLKLAAALVHDPQLLLLDEPTNGLDPPGRISMLRLIEDLIADTGKSVLLCTHLLGDVEKLCQQVVILHQGTVAYSGTMAELRAPTGDHYELGWQSHVVITLRRDESDGDAFLDTLKKEGVAVVSEQSTGKGRRTIVVTPKTWSPTHFFELAGRCGVVVTHLKPHGEDLQQVFDRLTNGATTGDSEFGVRSAELASIAKPA